VAQPRLSSCERRTLFVFSNLSTSAVAAMGYWVRHPAGRTTRASLGLSTSYALRCRSRSSNLVTRCGRRHSYLKWTDSSEERWRATHGRSHPFQETSH